MFRYRLRTLLIVLGPPFLCVGHVAWSRYFARPKAFKSINDYLREQEQLDAKRRAQALSQE